jgi:hypothetical protein
VPVCKDWAVVNWCPVASQSECMAAAKRDLLFLILQFLHEENFTGAAHECVHARAAMSAALGLSRTNVRAGWSVNVVCTSTSSTSSG